MHAITVRQTPAELRRRSRETMALLIACGLDPRKTSCSCRARFRRMELTWVLSCYTMFGELSRMTQFKDKSARYAENINAGLFTYPVLMADILLYQANLVPVGEDQKQHLELTRDRGAALQRRVRGRVHRSRALYPQSRRADHEPAGAGEKNEQERQQPNGFIAVLDSPDDILRKFKRAVTDSGSEVRRGPDKAGVNNLISIYGAVTGRTAEQTESEFAGKGYGDFKLAVAEAVIEHLRPIREKIRSAHGGQGVSRRSVRERRRPRRAGLTQNARKGLPQGRLPLNALAAGAARSNVLRLPANAGGLETAADNRSGGP